MYLCVLIGKLIPVQYTCMRFMACIGMYWSVFVCVCTKWYVLFVLVGNYLHLSVLICFCKCLCALVCIGMYDMYCMYLFILIRIGVF